MWADGGVKAEYAQGVVSSPSDHYSELLELLTPLLGPHTAKQALKLVAARSKAPPESLAEEHLELARDVLRPILRTLVGNQATRAVIDEMERRLG